MTIGKTNGMFLCFNPSCNKAGTLKYMLMANKGFNEFQAMRFMEKARIFDHDEFERELLAEEDDSISEFDQGILDRLAANLWVQPGGLEYMHGRGFTDDTLRAFGIGFSTEQQMVTVPVYDIDDTPVGLVGRSIEGKRFQNSDGLPRRKVVYNANRARLAGGTLILTEASFDSMKVHQAGYPGTGAVLGGYLSKQQLRVIDRNFSRIIIMTDFDNKEEHRESHCRRCKPRTCEGHNPGRDLGLTVATELSHKDILWAVYDYDNVFPPGKKDADQCTEDEIRQCIRNAMNTFEYESLGLY